MNRVAYPDSDVPADSTTEDILMSAVEDLQIQVAELKEAKNTTTAGGIKDVAGLPPWEKKKVLKSMLPRSEVVSEAVQTHLVKDPPTPTAASWSHT